MGERRCEGLAWDQYVGMHVHVVPNRGSSPTVLLRESYREVAKVAKRTLSKRLREDFGIELLVLVGDRSMISNKAIEATARARTDRADSVVGRERNPHFMPMACHVRTNSLGGQGNFGLAMLAGLGGFSCRRL